MAQYVTPSAWEIQFNLSDQQKRLSEYTDITVRVCCCWHFLYHQDCLCPICLEYFSFVAENANGFALLVIKMKPSHLMCDRSDTCKLCNTFTHAIWTRLDCIWSRIYCRLTKVPTKSHPRTDTHRYTNSHTSMQEPICHYGSLYAAKHRDVKLNLVQILQKFLSGSNKQTQTQTNTHSAAQVLGSIYCSATCRCNSSGMSIRAENGSFHSISHSNELQQNSLLCHTSTRWTACRLSETK